MSMEQDCVMVQQHIRDVEVLCDEIAWKGARVVASFIPIDDKTKVASFAVQAVFLFSE